MGGNQILLECLAVVNDGYHVLYITLRKLSVSQVLFFVDHCLLSVPIHNNTVIVRNQENKLLQYLMYNIFAYYPNIKGNSSNT